MAPKPPKLTRTNLNPCGTPASGPLERFFGFCEVSSPTKSNFNRYSGTGSCRASRGAYVALATLGPLHRSGLFEQEVGRRLGQFWINLVLFIYFYVYLNASIHRYIRALLTIIFLFDSSKRMKFPSLPKISVKFKLKIPRTFDFVYSCFKPSCNEHFCPLDGAGNAKFRPRWRKE